MQFDPPRLRFISLNLSGRVLMLVMGKLDRELPFLFLLHRELRDVGRAKREAHLFTWRGAHVTDGANAWACSHQHLAREELLPMTTHAGIVIGKIGDIGKVSFRIPCSWDFVTSIARQGFVFV
jgi:hypothetical protein